jgi:dienelactone hydrolase
LPRACCPREIEITKNRVFGMKKFLATLLLVLAAAGSHAGEKDGITIESGPLRVTIDGRSYELETLTVRPSEPGRYPLAVITHGTPRDPKTIGATGPSQLSWQTEEFARRGYVAVQIMRRGYGASTGAMADGIGECSAAIDYVKLGMQTAKDLRAAIDTLQQRPDVDSSSVIAIGQSSGGFGVLALSANPPPGLRAVISFAGGRGSVAPDTVCEPDRLVDATATFGSTSRVPELWIYADNDHYFGPEIARRMHEAFTKSGGKAELLITPANGADGHLQFHMRSGRVNWSSAVDSFLQANALPAHAVAFAAADNRPPPAQLNARGRQSWSRYLDSNDYRAFATGPDGHFGWAAWRRTQQEATDTAIKFCAVQECRIVEP